MTKKVLFTLIVLISFGTIVNAQSNYYIGVNSGSCQGCHSDIITQWQATAHAEAHPAPSTSYGYDCLSCHTTGWDTEVTNYGADEYVVKDDNATPNYVYTDEAAFNLRAHVQCEACHGAVGTSTGSVDFAHITPGARVTDYSAENCGTCHQDSHHPYYEEWSTSAHGSGAPGFLNDRANRASCMYCHFGQDFVGFLTDENYDGATFQVEGGDANLVAITCATCHNPHGSDNDADIRNLPAGFEGKVLCDVCHENRTEGVDLETRPHNMTSEALSGAPTFGYQYPGETYENSFHSNIQDRCITCHVNRIPFNYGTGEAAVTGHSFNPTLESCTTCHPGIDSFDLNGLQTKVAGLMEELQTLLNSATSEDSTTTIFKAANYNLNSVKADRSTGVHNPKFITKLLEDAIADLSTLVVSVNEFEGTPTNYSLSQNYPNPFNPSTTIEFSIPEAGTVKLVVYDALGKEISVLENKELAAGKYSYNWNAGDLASGIYFYKMESNNFVQVRKMLLVK
jgi:predicted CXXCH cytochrome family protein